MDAIGEAIGRAIGGLLDNPIVGLVVRLIGAYVVLVWLAAALWHSLTCGGALRVSSPPT
jgi:hypothetical protein